jgi:hypothetical protein
MTIWVVEAFKMYDYEGQDVLHIASGDEVAMKDLFSSVISRLVGELSGKKDHLVFQVEPDKSPPHLSGDARGICLYKQEDISESSIREFLGYDDES